MVDRLRMWVIAGLVAVMAAGAGMPAAGAAVVKVNETEYEAFDAAVKALKDGDTLTLVANASIPTSYTTSSYLDFAADDVDFDLDGYTLNTAGCMKISGSNVTVHDGTLSGTGSYCLRFMGTGEVARNVSANGGIMAYENSTVKVCDCTIWNTKFGALYTAAGSSVTVCGGTYGLPESIRYPFKYGSTSASAIYSSSDGGGDIVIEGGSFYGPLNSGWSQTVSIYGGYFKWCNPRLAGTVAPSNPQNSIKIYGGTFDFLDPDKLGKSADDRPDNMQVNAVGSYYNLVVSGHPVVANADGTYTVLAPIAVVPQPAEHTAAKVYTNGLEVAGSAGEYVVWYGTSVRVVFTADEGWYFAHLNTQSTNDVVARVSPTAVPGAKVAQPQDLGGGVSFLLVDGEGTVYGSGEMADVAASPVADLALTNLEVRSGITAVGARWFAKCPALATVDLAATVAKIGERAFYKCYGLTAAAIHGDGVTVGDDAFNRCNSLEELDFDGTASLGERVYSLQAAIYLRDGMPTVYTIPTVTMEGYRQVLEGKTALSDSEWTVVTTEAQKQTFRFFRIELRAEGAVGD